MDRDALLQTAVKLFVRHGLAGWSIAFRNFGHRLGCCLYRRKTIVLNAFYVAHNDESQVIDTLLHEIAHALTPGHRHGPVWKAMAQRLGATPRACSKLGVVLRPGKYRAVCPNCGRTYDKYRKPRYKCHSTAVTPYYCPKRSCGKKNGRLVFRIYTHASI